ncbi:HD domain-containing protein [Acidilobus sp.]|uniref:HD domain-containing protein n=1 Tax=Acidilobus sp. TaxID=1872109 RepID=UPI003D0781FB
MKKPCAFSGQSLVDHSASSYKMVASLLAGSYPLVVARRLRRHGIEIEDPARILRVAVELHDVGKAGEHYQGQFDDECNPLHGKQPSFKYHEIGTAIFFYYGLDLDEKLRVLLALAELNHLNALRGLPDFNFSRLPQGFSPDMLKLSRYGKQLLNGLGYSYDVRDYTADDYVRMMRGISSYVNQGYLKLYVLFLAPIIVGDNLDSASRAPEEKRRFVEILRKEVSDL